MRALKIGAWILGALLGLVLIGALLVWLLFDPNDYKRAVAGKFRETTGRELRLEGTLSIGFFPWLAVETGKASVSQPEGFGTEPFVSIGGARLGVRLWPLLRDRQLQFDEIRIDELQLDLRIAADGHDNWSDLIDRVNARAAKSAGEGTNTAATPSRTNDFSIASVRLADSRMSLTDGRTHQRYAIDRWSLETGRLEPGKPFDVETGLSVERNGQSIGDFDLRALVDSTKKGLIRLSDVDGEIKLAAESADPDRAPIELRIAELAYQTATRQMRLDRLAANTRNSELTATLMVSQQPHAIVVTGPLSVTAARLRGLAGRFGVDLPATRDADVFGSFSMTANLAYDGSTGIELSSLVLKLDQTIVEGRLAVADLARRAIRFDLSGDTLDVDRYLPPPKPGAERGPAGASDTLGKLRTLDLGGTLKARRCIVNHIALEDLSVSLQARDGVLRADPLEFRAFGGNGRSTLAVDVTGAVPQWRIEQSFEGVNTAAMLGQLVNVKLIEGRGRATFAVNTSGADTSAMLGNMRGRFDLAVENGAVVGVDFWHALETALAAAQHKKPPPGPGSGRTPFQVMKGRGLLGNRTLRNESMEFRTDFVDVTGKGDVNYGQGTLALDLTATLKKVPKGRLLGLNLKRIEGARIPVEVTGTIAKPSVKPDVAVLLSTVVIDTITKPFQGEASKQLKKNVKKLFGQ